MRAAGTTILADEALLAPLLDGARALEAEGAAAIMTSCGFLALYQRQLAAAVRVPVAASALVRRRRGPAVLDIVTLVNWLAAGL